VVVRRDDTAAKPIRFLAAVAGGIFLAPGLVCAVFDCATEPASRLTSGQLGLQRYQRSRSLDVNDKARRRIRVGDHQ
jgi:hypothetical protein